MANKRYALTQDLLREARQQRDAGIDCQFAIDNPRGLSIRVRGGEAAYCVQARPKGEDGTLSPVKRRLATVGAISISDAKSIGAEAVLAIKSGRNIDAILAARLAGKKGDGVAVIVDGADAAERRLWTFVELATAYTERFKPGGRSGNNAKEELLLRPTSITEIETRLRDRAENAELAKRFVKELRLDHLEAVRDRIHPSGEAARYVELAKRVLRWGLKHRRRFTGLEPDNMWWEALSHEHKMGDRSARYLTPSQIGTLMALLEAVRPLGDSTNDSVLAALQVVCMIPQRAMAAVNMRALGSNRWIPDPAPERAGWQVYTWLARDVKNKRDIRLSVPPVAIEIFERAARVSAQVLGCVSEWAFPQNRNKYRIRNYSDGSGTSPVPPHLDKHITPSALNQALDALAGRKPGWPDLLSIVGLPTRIGPHDLRRSVANFFENIGEGACASALLDHRVTGIDRMSREVAGITQGVYSAADRVVFKAAALSIWLEEILPAYQAAKNDPRLTKAVEARRESLQAAVEKRRESRQERSGGSRPLNHRAGSPMASGEAPRPPQ